MTDRPSDVAAPVATIEEQPNTPPVDPATQPDLPVDTDPTDDQPVDQPTDDDTTAPPARGYPDDDNSPADTDEAADDALVAVTAERDTALADLATAQARIADLEAQIAATQPDPTAEAQARAEAAELRATRLEAAADAGVPIALLRSLDQLHAATTSAQFTRAFSSIQQTLAASAQSTAGNPSPPSHPTEPPTLEQRIADAERSGDFTTAIRLKNERLRQL